MTLRHRHRFYWHLCKAQTKHLQADPTEPRWERIHTRLYLAAACLFARH